jgi:hypothetical protein
MHWRTTGYFYLYCDPTECVKQSALWVRIAVYYENSMMYIATLQSLLMLKKVVYICITAC